MNIRILLGLIPETSKYEHERDSLFEEFEKYLSYEKSDELNEFYRLKEEVHSEVFKNKVKEIKAQKFKDTSEYDKEKEYKSQKRSSDIKQYYLFKESGEPEWIDSYAKGNELKEIEKTGKYVNSVEFGEIKREMSRSGKIRYKETDSYKKLTEYKALKKDRDIKKFLKSDKEPDAEISKKIKAFEKLESLITGNEFIEEKAKIEKSTFKDTQEYKVAVHLKELKAGEDYKKYTKLLNSKKYKNYINLLNSDRIKNFEALEKYIQSEKFTKVKEYMLLSGNDKYKLSDEYKKVQAYHELVISENIIWYFKVTKADKFKHIKVLDKTFEDNFDTKKLETKKWITRYFWGDALVKQSYSLSTDKHFITDGKNIEINDSVLSVITRKEEVKGKAWDKKYGFFDKTFDYTSGLISSSNSFRQKYGLFEAKIKLNPTHPVNHAFWMVGDKMLPHIDIVKYNKIVYMNNYWLNGDEKVHKKIIRLNPLKLTTKYFIYSLEWKPGKITWKINGIPVSSTTKGEPQEAMYINFSSGIHSDKGLPTLPATAQIDWVRCYQFKEPV